jgi:hypothetical protein
MRVRVIDVEGEPEEIARIPELLAVLRGEEPADGPEPPADASPAGDAAALPNELRQHLERRSGPARRARAAQQFAEAVLGWGDADWEIGPSTQHPDGTTGRVRFHWRGPRRLGGFAYLYPHRGVVDLHLPADALDGATYVQVRKVKASDPYKLTCRLESPEAIAEAVVYARKALDATRR